MKSTDSVYSYHSTSNNEVVDTIVTPIVYDKIILVTKIYLHLLLNFDIEK